MGKWFDKSYDDELTRKIKSLFHDTMTKLQRENPETPPFDFADFVRGWDENDRFIRRLFEFLVKETASRHAKRRALVEREWAQAQPIPTTTILVGDEEGRDSASSFFSPLRPEGTSLPMRIIARPAVLGAGDAGRVLLQATASSFSSSSLVTGQFEERNPAAGGGATRRQSLRSLGRRALPFTRRGWGDVLAMQSRPIAAAATEPMPSDAIDNLRHNAHPETEGWDLDGSGGSQQHFITIAPTQLLLSSGAPQGSASLGHAPTSLGEQILQGMRNSMMEEVLLASSSSLLEGGGGMAQFNVRRIRAPSANGMGDNGRVADGDGYQHLAAGATSMSGALNPFRMLFGGNGEGEAPPPHARATRVRVHIQPAVSGAASMTVEGLTRGELGEGGGLIRRIHLLRSASGGARVPNSAATTRRVSARSSSSPSGAPTPAPTSRPPPRSSS